MRRIKIWLKIIFYYLASMKCCKKAKLLNAQDTTEWLMQSGKSLIRLGDGELNCIEGKDVHYQRYMPELQKEMQQLVDDYIQREGDCEYILCMPNEFLDCNGISLARKRVWVASWARFRYVFRKKFDMSFRYGDAFLFARAYENSYKRIWDEKKQVIFLHNSERYADEFQKKYNKQVVYIGIPSKDCYDVIDTLVDDIQNEIQKIENKQEAIVLISAGPCAKAIVFRLRNCGVQLVDTGHCWDEPLSLRGKGDKND